MSVTRFTSPVEKESDVGLIDYLRRRLKATETCRLSVINCDLRVLTRRGKTSEDRRETDNTGQNTIYGRLVLPGQCFKVTGVGRYVGFTPMWERTICGFRAGRRGYTQRACFVISNQCNLKLRFFCRL